jgi:acyl carrier protein
MTHPMLRHRLDRDGVRTDIGRILEDMLSDWDGFEGEIRPETLLVKDLGCSSVEIVELVVTIEDHFDAPNLPFQELLMLPDGRYVEDLRVAELADFVFAALARPPASRDPA